MKKVLTGLLMFSQAAVQATVIDKDNYRQHLCDDGLLKGTSVVYEGAPDSHVQFGKDTIKADHSVYCHYRSKYEIAVEENNKHKGQFFGECNGFGDKMSRPDCVVKAGIFYANTCEKLKQDKVSNPRAWNEVMPTLTSCNNMRLR